MPNEPQRAPTNVFSHDRRRFARRCVKSLAYIDLGNDTGGIILNISEGGLAVHSAVALTTRTLPSIHFQLPNSPEWVAARGDIAWIDASQKNAGIRLADLPDAAQGQIRDWIASSPNDSADSGDAALGEAMQLTSLTLAGNPAARDANSQRESDGPREIDSIDRKLRLHFARRDSDSARESRANRGIWWALVGAVGFLALLSFGFGWIAGRGKIDAISGVIAGVKSRIAAHAQYAAQAAPAPRAAATGNEAALSANVTASANSAPTRNAAASSAPRGNDPANPPPAGPLLPRVTVSTRAYVPVPDDSAAASESVRRLVMGHILDQPDPAYPPEAVSQRIQGTVQLRATIAADGSVNSISVISGAPLLVSAAEDAVRRWRFSPTILDGLPVATEQAITIVFSLAAAK